MESLFDIIFLFGPPIPCKEKHVPKYLLAEHFVNVSVEHLYVENPCFGLRDVALSIISTVRKHKQVIVEGNLVLASTRKSLIRIINKKLPSCSMMFLKMFPAGGYSQVMWAWHSTINLPKGYVMEDESDVKRWFDLSQNKIKFSEFVEEPTPDEGFEVREMNVTLKGISKFETAALLMQYEALLSDDGELGRNVVTLCSNWLKVYSSNHVIIICDDKDRYSIKLMKNTLSKLVEKINHPVYVLQLPPAQPGSYSHPPNPGALAFLQSQHALDLHCHETLYVYKGSEYKEMAIKAGIKHISIDAASKASTVITDAQHHVTPAIPSMLDSVFEKRSVEDSKEAPLIEEFSEERLSLCVCKECHMGYKEYLFIKSWDSLRRFKLKCQSHARNQDDSSHLKRKSGAGPSGIKKAASTIPDWMKTKKDKKDKVNIPTPSGPCRSETVYLLTEKELLDMAKQVLSEAGMTDIAEDVKQ